VQAAPRRSRIVDPVSSTYTGRYWPPVTVGGRARERCGRRPEAPRRPRWRSPVS